MSRVFKERVCVICGSTYIPTGVKQKCCSEACLVINSKQWRDEYKKINKEHIKETRRKYNIKNKEHNSIYCKNWYKNNKVYVVRICEICGIEFSDVNARQVTCSVKCAKEHKNIYNKNYYQTEDGKKTSRRAAGKRRALQLGTITEKIDYDMINKRDSFKCQICGKKVDINLKHPDTMCKSYDHIVPLSRGGEHTNRNIQLTHLKCNLSKHNNISSGVQMHLF